MNKKLNIICSAVSFGLGPVGKLCSIVYNNDNINWFLCGDKIDMNIFSEKFFLKKVFTRDEKEIELFIKNNNITHALVVLDGELATLYKKLGLIVLYVDSLPFMWQESDVVSGDVPLNVDYYCAQKNFSKKNSSVLEKAYNLINVDPILPIFENNNKDHPKYDVVINLGGMSINNVVESDYIDIIIPTLINAIDTNKLSKKILITCGFEAANYVKKILNELSFNLDITIDTIEHNKYLYIISKSNLLITTAGLTTIMETCNYKIPTIILPPSNLSQYYNQDIAKKILYKYHIIEWPYEDLKYSYIKTILDYGEEKIVKIIQNNIKSKLNDNQFTKNTVHLFDNITFNINKNFIGVNNGTKQIREILENFIKE